MLEIPKFDTLEEKLKFLVENKASLIAQKCATIKYADGIGVKTTVINGKPHTTSISKGLSQEEVEGAIQVKVVINTTGIMDSHDDVHIKGLWNKSLKENKRIMHLQEHKSNSFQHIISNGDDLKSYVQDYSWKDLGYDADGNTEALVFESNVKEKRNKFMFDQYKDGYVDNHSVGMRYVKLELAVDSDNEDWKAEKALFDAHIDKIVNKEDAQEQKYFWIVKEARVIEGSAVPNGSNPVTPTLSTSKTEAEIKVEKDMSAMKAFLNIE